MTKTILKKGDIVEVCDNGKTYTTYLEMAQKLKAKKFKNREFCSPENCSMGKIINIDTEEGICLVEIGKVEYLIHADGLELYDEEKDIISARHEDFDDGFILKDSGKKQNFESGAVRDTSENKPRYDLIPPHALKRLAMIYTKGAEKYGDRNWEKGIPFSRCLASEIRHVEAYRRNENEEDHLAQAVWNLMAIMEFESIGRTDLDDMIKYDRKEI